MLVDSIKNRLVASAKYSFNRKNPDPFALEKFLSRGITRFLWNEIRNEGITGLGSTLRASITEKDLAFRPDRTLGETLALQASRFGSKPYIYFENENFSYNLINDNAARVARPLLANQIAAGSRVGILLPNLPAYLEIFFATQRIGATAVPINIALKDDGLAYILNDAGIALLFVTAAMLQELDRIRERIKTNPQIVVVPETRHEPVPELPNDNGICT